MRTNQRLAQLWLDALTTELGASAGTIDTYTDDLNCYLAWLDENSLGLDDVGLEHIRDYIAALDQRGYAGSTMARRITVARGLHKFLIAEELGSRDPTSNCRPCAGPGSCRSFCRLPRRKRSWRPRIGLQPIPRWVSTVRPAMPAGLRCSRPSMPPACASAKRCRCPPMRHPLAPACCLVRGKGDKQRLVPLHDRAIEALAQWQRLASAYSGG